MKFNININQKALADTKLDLKDATILDYLIHYCNSRNARIEYNRLKDNQGSWTWINYNGIIDDNPMLRISSKGAISDRISVLREAGFIETKVVDSQKMYYRMTAKVDELFFENKAEPFVQEKPPLLNDERPQGGAVLNDEHYYNTIYNNTSNHVVASKNSFASTIPELLESKGFYLAQSKKPDENDCYPDVWYTPQGKPATKSELAKVEHEFKQATEPTPKADERPDKIIGIWNSYPNANAMGVKSPPNASTTNELLPEVSVVTKDLKRQIAKHLRAYPEASDWRRAINNYANDILNRRPNKDNDYHMHRMSLYEFCLQKNGFLRFVNK